MSFCVPALGATAAVAGLESQGRENGEMNYLNAFISMFFSDFSGWLCGFVHQALSLGGPKRERAQIQENNCGSHSAPLRHSPHILQTPRNSSKHVQRGSGNQRCGFSMTCHCQ